MSDGTSIYSMITGIGDAFGRSYDSGRRQAQEDEAPNLISQYIGASSAGAGAPAAAGTFGAMGQVPRASAEPAAARVPTFVGLSGENPSAAKKMNGTNADFISAMMPHALEASKATGVDPRIILAQSAIETGWGRSAPGNNYFGIKSHGQAGGNTLATTEVVNGAPVRVKDSFRAFPSMADSATGYAEFINANPRYAGLKSAQDLEAQASALQASGYATDPHYGGKVLSIARRLPDPRSSGGPAPVAVANNEADTQALEARMGMTPGAAPQATAEADMPAADAKAAQFQVPGQAAPVAAPASPQGFAGFGTRTTRSSPEQMAALQAMWKNPVTRPVATQIYGSLMKGEDSAWTLSTMGDQPVLFNAKTAQIVPVGQAKRSTTTVGNVVVDTNTGQPIYEGPDKEANKLQSVAPGTTLYDPRARQPVFTAPAAEKDDGSKVREQVLAREEEARRLGLTPGTPTFQTFALTGKIGRDQELSATDKKAIQEADEGVLSAQTAIESLRQAKDLSKKAYEGPSASMRGMGMSMFGSEDGIATAELENVVGTNALGQLKAIFGGNPTEGERKILLELQGSVSKPDVVRQKIFDRGIALAEKRLGFNQRRADELRDGTFYKAEGAPGAPKTGSVPKGEDRMAIPGGKSAAAALSEAKAVARSRPDLKPQLQERLRTWGIDPKRLDD